LSPAMPGPGGQWRGAQGTEEYRPVALVAAPAHAALRGLADPRVPRPQPGVPGLVRPGPRAGADRQVAHRAGRRDARLVARRRVPDRRAVLDGPGDRPRGAAGRRGDGCPVGAVRSGRAAVAQAAAQLAAGAGRAGRGAELLAALPGCPVPPRGPGSLPSALSRPSPASAPDRWRSRSPPPAPPSGRSRWPWCRPA
jgi:hypothetical protein